MGIKARTGEFMESRIRRGFSQKELALAIGKHPHYIYMIEKGIASCSPKSARDICSKLDTNFDKIFFTTY